MERIYFLALTLSFVTAKAGKCWYFKWIQHIKKTNKPEERMLDNFTIVLITGEVTVWNYSSLPTNICMTQGMTFSKGTRSQKLVLPPPHITEAMLKSVILPLHLKWMTCKHCSIASAVNANESQTLWKVKNCWRKTKEFICAHSLRYKLHTKLFHHSCEFSPVKLVFKLSICLLIIQLHKVECKLRANRVQTSCDIVRLFELLVILYCKKNLFNLSAARARILYPLCFSRLIRNEQKDLVEK